ncbi:hypothetical protein BRYFOR_07938 [Marvinbryantia formatexigens DSM 14469]|uniref:Uncharacterized protein n=2 Tax=Marvinbryantia TaxID=248744 RepID=C6LH28_9FIRM|nr:hypothetical protein BRYFOR_07938 [Marvinbryantia formatexigens DSM 14469]
MTGKDISEKRYFQRIWARKRPRTWHFGKGEYRMPVCDYEVVMIDGDYAHLRRLEDDGETKLVARALLPPEIREGSILHYEMLQYSIIG